MKAKNNLAKPIEIGNNSPKNPKPKIILIDMPVKCRDTLYQAGYNISVGSFGTPYIVPRCDSLFPVGRNTCQLPNCEEQDVIILNTSIITPSNQHIANPGNGVDTFWQDGTWGRIDPRPISMYYNAKPAFDNIINHGGIFIVVMGEKYNHQYHFGNKPAGYRNVQIKKSDYHSNYSFIKLFSDFNITNRYGYEI